MAATVEVMWVEVVMRAVAVQELDREETEEKTGGVRMGVVALELVREEMERATAGVETRVARTVEETVVVEALCWEAMEGVGRMEG